MDNGIRFAELLAYTDQEHARWKRFFEENPQALDLACDVAGAGTVRELVFHIFAVNLYYAHRLLGLERPDFKALPHASTDELFAIDRESLDKLTKFLAQTPPEEWDVQLPIGFVERTASKRKMLAQAFLHGVHHRAQLATFLRQSGFKQDWIHDLILSDAMQ